jgi:hypothetical protein
MSSQTDDAAEDAGVGTETESLIAAGLCSCGCGQPLSRDSDAYKAERSPA